MSVSRCSLKPEVVSSSEVPYVYSLSTYDEKSSSHDYMQTVKSCGYEEGRPVYTIGDTEGCLVIFKSLEGSEVKTKEDCNK